MNSPGYHKDVGSRPSCPQRSYHWLKRNFKTVLLVLLALAGLALALINFLEPCVTEAVLSHNEVPFLNITIVEERFVRLVPMDMHVTMDHSGSMGNDDKFANAKLGMIQMWTTINNETAKLAEREDAVPGSVPDLRFALSKWTNAPSEVLFSLTTLTTALTGVDDFTNIPKGGTAIGTGLARCVLEFVPEITASPTKAPTSAPTVDSLANSTSTVVTDNAGALYRTETCLIVTDGVAFDTTITYELGKTNATLIDECNVWKNTFSDEIKAGLGTCQSTIHDTALDEVVLACTRLGVSESECTAVNIAAALRARGIVVLGMYVGDSLVDTTIGQPFLENITSCVEPEFADQFVDGVCPFFVSSNTTEVVPAATALATALIDSFASQSVSQVTTITNTTTVLEPQTEYICAGDPLYLIFLMFLIPLAAYIFWRPFTLLFAKYCCPSRYEDPEFVYMDQQQPGPLPQQYAFTPEPQAMDERILQPSWHQPPPAAITPGIQARNEPNAMVEKKHYKWSVKKTDHYLWNLGAAGVGPVHVNFGAASPPSAPRMPVTSSNMNRRTQRVSMRWSYVPPETRASARASTRISSALYDAVIPNYERASDRLEPFQEDEMQPGDLDYEYTMCLMKWFPCLRPRKPPAGKAKQQQRKGSSMASFNPQLSPQMGGARGNQQNNDWSYSPSEFAGESQAPSEDFGKMRSYAQQSEYSQSQYGQSQYGQSQDNQSQYGQSQDNQSQYGQSQYDQSQYDQSQYDQSQYSQSQYDQSQYSQSQYDQSQYSQSQYDGSQYGESQYDQGSQYNPSQYSQSEYGNDGQSEYDNDRQSEYGASSYAPSEYGSSYAPSEYGNDDGQSQYSQGQSVYTQSQYTGNSARPVQPFYHGQSVSSVREDMV